MTPNFPSGQSAEFAFLRARFILARFSAEKFVGRLVSLLLFVSMESFRFRRRRAVENRRDFARDFPLVIEFVSWFFGVSFFVVSEWEKRITMRK